MTKNVSTLVATYKDFAGSTGIQVFAGTLGTIREIVIRTKCDILYEAVVPVHREVFFWELYAFWAPGKCRMGQEC
jgi:hypothetical protein